MKLGISGFQLLNLLLIRKRIDLNGININFVDDFFKTMTVLLKLSTLFYKKTNAKKSLVFVTSKIGNQKGQKTHNDLVQKTIQDDLKLF